MNCTQFLSFLHDYTNGEIGINGLVSQSPSSLIIPSEENGWTNLIPKGEGWVVNPNGLGGHVAQVGDLYYSTFDGTTYLILLVEKPTLEWRWEVKYIAWSQGSWSQGSPIDYRGRVVETLRCSGHRGKSTKNQSITMSIRKTFGSALDSRSEIDEELWVTNINTLKNLKSDETYSLNYSIGGWL